MLENDLYLKAHRGEQIPRFPVWVMRQAGRILPEYRALRAKLKGFKELVETPHLAAEVTVQPIDRLDVDAAILFSDILVVPDAMGLKYEMVEQIGPFFTETIRSTQDLKKLDQGMDVKDRLSYVFETIRITQLELRNRVPLIGFAGAPWTIFCYMVEGKGSKTFSEAKKMIYSDPVLAHELLNRITEFTIAYMKEQQNSGVDALQLFDSWAGILGKEQYAEFAIPYVKKIAESFLNFPFTVFSKGAYASMPQLATLPCTALGLDWNMEFDDIRDLVGETKTLQGNLDPCLLYADKKTIEKETKKLLESFKSSRHIVNLGHGVYPDVDFEHVQVFINTVKNYETKFA